MGRQPRPWFTTPGNPAFRFGAAKHGFPGNAKAREGQFGLPGRAKTSLLELDFSASFFKLLLSSFGISLGHGFLDGLGGTVNEVLGFFQAQAGDFTHGLDDADLVRADFSQHDVEFGLFFSSSTRGATGCGSSAGDSGGSSRHTE